MYPPKNLKLVIQAILKTKEKAPHSSTIELHASPENKLNTISKLELSKILTDLQCKEYVIRLSASSSEALDKESIFSITPCTDLRNWYAAYLLRIKRKLQNLPPKTVKRLSYLSDEINENFQANSSSELWVYTDENYADCLRFLHDQTILIDYTNTYEDGTGDITPGFTIKATLNVSKFLKFYAQIKRHNEALREALVAVGSLASKTKIPKGIQWKDITLKFINGHEIKIKAKQHTWVTDFKEMGFQDIRTRRPNQQWALLECLAQQNGQISWSDSAAHETVKKKKQRLSRTLQKYFNIAEDPFLPYKPEKAYALKIQFI